MEQERALEESRENLFWISKQLGYLHGFSGICKYYAWKTSPKSGFSASDSSNKAFWVCSLKFVDLGKNTGARIT